LITDPEVLVLDEPTSAVDSHTEARIARGVRDVREGRTTVVFTSSPLLLDHADRVVLVHEGTVAAVGVHRELVHSEPRYRAVVTRETDEEAARNGVLDELPRAGLHGEQLRGGELRGEELCGGELRGDALRGDDLRGDELHRDELHQDELHRNELQEIEESA
jgi:putative ABC transport system ATP-binding protein